MDHLRLIFTLLAQAPAGGAAAEPPAPPLVQLLVPIVAAIALYYFMIVRPERRKQTGQRSQLDMLKKNDRVVTIGGIYGVVMNVEKDSDSVTLKVDEANNTKIRVTFGAIGRVLGEDSAADKSA